MRAFGGFFDDASLFPPANLPLDQAVRAHRAHRASWYAEAVGPFVCAAARVPELGAAIGGEPLSVALTVPSGPLGLQAALAECAHLEPLRLTAVEVLLPDGMAAQEALAMLDDQLPAGVTSYLEVPRGARTHAVLDSLAGTRHRAKFRTGGVEPSAHPGERELADAVLGAVSRGVPFKCTAGLHHAVRHTDGALEQHGFLNVLLAVDAALQGAGIATVAALLAERSGDEVARATAAAGDRLAAARACLVSIGTCSIAEPIADLVALGLLRQPETSRG
jgi:hypothetical protein